MKEQDGGVDGVLGVQSEPGHSLGLNLCYIVPLGDLGREALERESGRERRPNAGEVWPESVALYATILASVADLTMQSSSPSRKRRGARAEGGQEREKGEEVAEEVL